MPPARVADPAAAAAAGSESRLKFIQKLMSITQFSEATAEEELDDDDDWQYEEEEDDES